MQKTQKIEEERDILNSYYHGLYVWDLLGMINSAIYIHKMDRPDWDKILENIRLWSGVELMGLTAQKLKSYYEHTLVKISNYSTYFVIDKIQDVRAKNDELEALIDWKYFPPSDPKSNNNWYCLNLVDDSFIYDYVNRNQEQANKFKQEMRQLPVVYQEKLKGYLDFQNTRKTLFGTQRPF